MDPFFELGNITNKRYLQSLEGAIDPALTAIIAYDENHLISQQDGTPPHYPLIIW